MIFNFLHLFYWTCITRFFIWRLHFMPCCKSLACMGIDGLIVMWDKRTNWSKEINLQIKTLFECASMICVGAIESITTSLQNWPNNFWPHIFWIIFSRLSTVICFGFLLNFALWLVQKTHTILSTNQMQN